MRRIRGLIGLVLLLALAVGLPWALVAAIGNPLHQWTSIKAGDMSDQDVIAIMAAIAYLAWASFVLALLVELAASLVAAVTRRPRRSIRIPLLGVQQDLARTLIATVLLLAPAVMSVVGPATSAFASTQPPASTSTAPQHESASPSAATTAQAPTPARPATSTAHEDRAGTGTYVIPSQGGMRSYWALAEHYLGDGQRWPEIWHLNEGHHQHDGSVMESPNLLRRGWTVTVPAPAAGSPAAQASSHGEHAVTVREGDTLSDLAEDAGVPDWTTVWPANEDRAEPGGQHLTDPNLIKPGWTVLLPGAASSTSQGSTVPSHTSPHRPPARTTPHHQPQTSTPTHSTPSAQPSSPAEPTTPARLATGAPTHADQPAHAASHSNSSEVVMVAEWAASLSAGAGVLAGGLFLALRRYRRRQFRHRGAGRAIAGPAPQHVPLEKVLVTDGSAGVRDIDFIDRALRGLSLSVAAADGRLPSVLAARLTEQHLDLVLADPQMEAPPPPWVAVSPTSWAVEKSADPPTADSFDQIPAAPYPTLVSVGYTAAGEEWLVDLEQCGSLVVEGDRERCLDLTRFVAAELAHNVWSDHLTVTLAGELGAELVELNPSRLIYTDDISAAAAVAANDVRANRVVADGAHVDVLHGRLHSVSGDTWMPQVLLLCPAEADPVDTAVVESLLDTVEERSSRTAVAVVLLPGPQPSVAAAGLQLHVDASGTLTIPALGVTATAQQLPAGQAMELGQYLAAVRDSTADVPMPSAEVEDGTTCYTDLAGAVLPEHTVPRSGHLAVPPAVVTVASAAALPPLAADPATAASLLPNSTSSYLGTTAATLSDIEALAPVVKPEVSAALLAADPHLAEDLAAWLDEASDRPKVRLLGEVQVTAPGQRPDAKTAIATEAVAYLALHAGGVTGDRFAADFWPQNNYTIKDSNPKNLLSIVRSWLGVNPQTGSPCLPYAIGRAAFWQRALPAKRTAR